MRSSCRVCIRCCSYFISFPYNELLHLMIINKTNPGNTSCMNTIHIQCSEWIRVPEIERGDVGQLIQSQRNRFYISRKHKHWRRDMSYAVVAQIPEIFNHTRIYWEPLTMKREKWVHWARMGRQMWWNSTPEFYRISVYNENSYLNTVFAFGLDWKRSSVGLLRINYATNHCAR